MANLRGDGAYIYGEGAGPTAAEKDSLPADEYKASPSKNAAVIEPKELLASTVECKRRTLGPQGEAPAEKGVTVSQGNKNKGSVEEKWERATPFTVYSLKWLFSNIKNCTDMGLAPVASTKDAPSVENMGIRDPVASSPDNTSRLAAKCKG
ncbi:hypothetical protein NDU88_008327 [Pleurodeles waltl]|uniref:Uncharacterized protein n=1 Tax=Pleurodeles waltl TaxID=8319 RepID=A0AAV7RXN4_PLEWA|nr:hypothetical protein NDU88_008327 [Pleurodeles waltl]